jgi:hypothetical protein
MGNWVVRDAVCREPVSGVIFPVNREFTGKFALFGLELVDLRLKSGSFQGLSTRFPYSP